MSWVFYSIFAQAFCGVTKIADKYVIDKHTKNPVISTVLTSLIPAIAGVITLVIFFDSSVEINKVLFLILSGFINIFAGIPYFKAMKIDDASRIVPLFQFIPIFSLILSYIFLNERLTYYQIIGFIVILLFGIIISLEEYSLKFLKLRKSFWNVVLTSFVIALTLMLFKQGSINDNYGLTFAYNNLGMGLGCILLYLVPKVRNDFNLIIPKINKSGWKGILTAGISFLMFRYLRYFSLYLGPVSLVAVLGATQSVFVLFYSFLITKYLPGILKEDISRKTIGVKIISIVGILVGVYLISIR